MSVHPPVPHACIPRASCVAVSPLPTPTRVARWHARAPLVTGVGIGMHDPTISNGEPTETPEHMWLAEGNA
jgi:hypothetical protein